MRRRAYRDDDEYGIEESPRKAVNPSYTRFNNPSVDPDFGGQMRAKYAGNPRSGGMGKERHASPGDEFGVPDTMKIPAKTNAETGYLRPERAEASGSCMSPKAVHAYALKPRASYRER